MFYVYPSFYIENLYAEWLIGVSINGGLKLVYRISYVSERSGKRKLYPRKFRKENRAVDFMTKDRTRKSDSYGETATKYAYELALQRMGVDMNELTGYEVSTWQMEWGLNYEPDARTIYENSRNVKCFLPGFMQGEHMSGCTPDGLIELDEDDTALLEIKCPQWANHMSYLLNGPPRNYVLQMQFQMMVTGRKWCDYMIFNPEAPQHLAAKVFRYDRDESEITYLLGNCVEFEELIEEYYNKLS